jgi:hypothetical protein
MLSVFSMKLLLIIIKFEQNTFLKLCWVPRSEIEHEHSIESFELSEYKITPNSKPIRTFLYLKWVSKIVRIKGWHWNNQKTFENNFMSSTILQRIISSREVFSVLLIIFRCYFKPWKKCIIFNTIFRWCQTWYYCHLF